MKQDIRIKVGDGPWVQIKSPLTGNFTIERYNLTKSGRLASGLMVMDLIAKKRKFLFRYPAITARDMNTILDLIDGTTMFFSLSYWENNVIKYATCYVGHIPSTIHRTGENWVWTDVDFDLIER